MRNHKTFVCIAQLYPTATISEGNFPTLPGTWQRTVGDRLPEATVLWHF